MRMNWRNLVIALGLIGVGFSCGNSSKEAEENKELPILGRHDYTDTDTIYHTIADFKFVDQDSNWVTNDTFRDKVYVADFFFTSCPTICPIMKTQMLRVYDSLGNENDLGFLSHTIDPKHDTVAVLKEFADRLGVNSEKWRFVTGEKEDIYKIAQTSYYVTTIEDGSEPGGFIHSGAFILVDKDQRIRGVYDGTKEEDVNLLMKDIKKLLASYQ